MDRTRADTKQPGTRLLVSHGRSTPAGGGPRCSGGIATVTEARQHNFTAECQCGWRFHGMHTDGYAAA